MPVCQPPGDSTQILFLGSSDISESWKQSSGFLHTHDPNNHTNTNDVKERKWELTLFQSVAWVQSSLSYLLFTTHSNSAGVVSCILQGGNWGLKKFSFPKVTQPVSCTHLGKFKRRPFSLKCILFSLSSMAFSWRLMMQVNSKIKNYPK